MAKTTVKEIKEAMALPPIPQQPQRTRSDRDRNRDRIRLEISTEQCAEFTSMLADRLRATPKDSPAFKQLYGVYWGLKAQMSKEKPNAH